MGAHDAPRETPAHDAGRHQSTGLDFSRPPSRGSVRLDDPQGARGVRSRHRDRPSRDSDTRRRSMRSNRLKQEWQPERTNAMRNLSDRRLGKTYISQPRRAIGASAAVLLAPAALLPAASAKTATRHLSLRETSATFVTPQGAPLPPNTQPTFDPSCGDNTGDQRGGHGTAWPVPIAAQCCHVRRSRATAARGHALALRTPRRCGHSVTP
jgi:hypothetical protein